MMKTKKTVKPAMAMVTALFLLGGYSAQATAGTLDFVTTEVGDTQIGCVSTGTLCDGINLLDAADDTINLFGIAPDVAGFRVFVNPREISSDTGSANVLLNGGLVGALSTANPLIRAAFVDTSVEQVVQIVNTDATLLNYEFTATAVPIPAAAWLFGSALLGLIGVARRRRG